LARFLIAAWPYSGHVHPSVSLARVLRDRGHEVAFYTGAMPDQPVEREGFVRFGFKRVAGSLSKNTGLADGSDAPSLYTSLTARYTSAHLRNPVKRAWRLRSMYREMITGTIAAQAEDLAEISAKWRPDVIVSDPLLWAPFVILSETQDAPVAVFSFYAGCLVPGPDAPPAGTGLPSPRTLQSRFRSRVAAATGHAFSAHMRRDVDTLRRQYGLSSLGMPVAAWLARMPLHLVCSSPELDFGRRDLPPSVQYVGPCPWDRPSSAPSPEWLSDAPNGRPLVYVTEGTAQVKVPVLLNAAFAGLADLPIDVVVTTGIHREPSNLHRGAPLRNIRVSSYIPHEDLFPKVALVVTTGGSNTVPAALQAGVPLVVVPMEWDQLDNAQRVAEAGAGVRLPLRRCTGATLRASVQHVLATPRFRAGAERIAESFSRYRKGARAAELLEELSARRRSWRSHNGRNDVRQECYE